MSQPKVFEFAKEIGMSPLALMDKIREWKLPVRSHMAELEPEIMEQIKAKLKGGGEPAPEAPAKKKVAKKAAAKKPAAKASSAPDASVGAKKTKRTATTAAPKTAEAEVVDAAPGKKGVVVKKAAAKIVVRKKQEEEEAAAAAAAAAEIEAAEAREVEAAEAAAEAEAARLEARAQEAEAVVPGPTPDVPGTVAAAPASAPEAAPVAPVAAGPVGVPGGPTLGGSRPGPGGPPGGRKREVVMTAGGPQSGIKSEPPRRNIVGRMDLSRVTAPGGTPQRPGGPLPGGPGSRPTFGGPSRPGLPGSGPRPLRTGFVASGPVEIEDEATLEARRRFDEKRRPKAGAAAAGPATKEKEEVVATFSATEFRKREMVFQPKKKKGMLNRVAMRTEITKPKASKRVVKVNQTMKLSDLAVEMGVKAGQLTKELMKQGVMATMNTDLDFDTIALIAPTFDFEAQNIHQTVDEMIGETAFGEMTAETIIRPPVVTIMGHVDHGKTSLLDVIRKANVAGGEAGGITQHIGAYQVTTESGALITFIDTPGHEAFTAMRARGANATDIAIIVVAADDGVMPQTIEAVSHAKAAGVPIIVALNKMDKPGANPDRVKQQLTEQQLVPEEWGGDTMYMPVSALTKEGIPQLLEQIALVAEVEQLMANPKRSATGVVIESRMDKGRGAVATLLVQDGTIEIGQ
ncbi:MAG: translation initiation factor IF-2 N-terminal domain-containing protein, partial [Bdellovibrionota bacterium]